MTRVHEAIQQTAEGDEDLGDSVLVGWLVIAEWIDSNGQRRLSRSSGTGDGERLLTPWQRKGYLHEALDGGWR